MSSDTDIVHIRREVLHSTSLSSADTPKDSSEASEVKHEVRRRTITPRQVGGTAPISTENAPVQELPAEYPVKSAKEKGIQLMDFKSRPSLTPIVKFTDRNKTILVSDEGISSTPPIRSVQENEKGAQPGSTTAAGEQTDCNVAQGDGSLLYNNVYFDTEKSGRFSEKTSEIKENNSVDASCITIAISKDEDDSLNKDHSGALTPNGEPRFSLKHCQNHSQQMPLDVNNPEESSTDPFFLDSPTKDHTAQRNTNVPVPSMSGSCIPTDVSHASFGSLSDPKIKNKENHYICDVYTAESSGAASTNVMSPFPLFRLHQMKLTTSPHGVFDSLDTSNTPSPFPVTLIYAGQLQRKKHLKRVSYYILGPLLGEGIFGVVRDAIDTSASRMIPPQFQRVAIKSFKYRRESVSKQGVLPMTNEEIIERVNSESNLKNSLQSSSRPPILSSKQIYDERIRRMHEDEVSNLQRFHCPNIIRAIDIFTRYGKDYVALPIAICNLEQLLLDDFCHETFPQHSKGAHIASELTIELSTASFLSMGDSLGNMLRLHGHDDPVGTNFSAALIKGIMYQLLFGVVYLHRQGLAHNDLKPQNILLYADGVIKITDLGSVSTEYNDQGTPLFLSPEICKYFYAACDAEDMKNETEVKLSALKNDMWSCGVILYYLLVGRTPWCGVADMRNKYQLYRKIAAQSTAIDLSHVSEPSESEQWKEDPSEASIRKTTRSKTASSAPFPPSSLRHLLSLLLDINPDTRLSAEEAIRHPSLQSLHKMGHNDAEMIEAVQQNVAKLVLLSPHVRRLIKRDREQHLQFVAECCFMLDIPLPEEIFLPAQESTGSSENEPVLGVNQTSQRRSDMEQRGTVDRRLFCTEADYHYYEKKLGKSEYDVCSMLNSHAKVKMMYDYLYHTVLVECGYRTASEVGKKREHILRKLRITNDDVKTDMTGFQAPLSSTSTPAASPVTPPSASRPNTAKRSSKRSQVNSKRSCCCCGLM